MDALAFLYIALGVGFLILVVFISAVLINIIPMLRDINSITKSGKEIAERINDVLVHPFHIVNQMVETFRPIIESIKNREQTNKKKSKE